VYQVSTEPTQEPCHQLPNTATRFVWCKIPAAETTSVDHEEHYDHQEPLSSSLTAGACPLVSVGREVPSVNTLEDADRQISDAEVFWTIFVIVITLFVIVSILH